MHNGGQSRQQATRTPDRASTADKNELLFRHEVKFNDVTSGSAAATAVRRRVRVERNLPMKDTYRSLIERLATTGAYANLPTGPLRRDPVGYDGRRGRRG
jgi:hypothetical protein